MRKDFLPFGKPSFGLDEEESVLRVLRRGWIGMGPETIAFEAELAEYLGVPHVVTVNSCTSALFLSLLVNGVGAGDEVVVPSLTWCSTANAPLYLGAVPVLCDVDPETLCATWETIEPHLSSRTRAVIVVHYGGLSAETQRIRDKLPPGVALVEDAAHALGSIHVDGSMVGSHGSLACFSFYANKNLSTGEGGAIALTDSSMAARLRSLRLHALQNDAWRRFQNRELLDMALTELGYKMNYTDLQASIGRVQLRRQEEFHRQRIAIASRYRESLQAIMPRISWQSGWEGPGRHAAHMFVVKLDLDQLTVSRDQLLLEMRRRNIGAGVHYAPLHRMPLYNQGRIQANLPNTDAVGDRILTLPISQSMTLDDCEDVLDAFSEVLAGKAVIEALT